jgi:triosephosphate isomerase
MNNETMISCNWKMNPSTLEEATKLTQHIIEYSKNIPNKTKILLVVPFPFIYCVSMLIKDTHILLGGQDCHSELVGPYTSGVSISMLKSLGCSHVLAGHSERRQLWNDTNEIINKKVRKILQYGLQCILCIGENKTEYEKGQNKEICAKQLSECLAHCNENDLKKVIIAYEPIWAIGTGLHATTEIISDVHSYIRNWFKIHYSETIAKTICIQYGGSVNPENVSTILNIKDVNGVLVGSASLDSEKISKIMNCSSL